MMIYVTGWYISAYKAKILQRQKQYKKAKGFLIVRNAVMWLKCK